MNTHFKLILKSGEEIVLHEPNLKAKIENNIIYFQIEEMKHTIDLEKEIFTRENEEYLFTLDIKNKKCEITLKKEEYILQVEVEYAILLRNQKEIKISYLIETDDQMYQIVIELEEGLEI